MEVSITGTTISAALDKATELPDVYVCGPPALLESVKAVAKARGLPSTQIFKEQVQAG
jgi:ferredoxin-NADP reductase